MQILDENNEIWEVLRYDYPMRGDHFICHGIEPPKVCICNNNDLKPTKSLIIAKNKKKLRVCITMTYF